MRRYLFAIVLAAAASPVAAQPAPWEPERVTAGWVFTPALALGGMWDSNVTIRQEGDPRSEQLVGVVAPRGELGFRGKRTRFNAGYAGTLTTYRELAELQRYEQRGRLMASHAMTPRLEFRTRHSMTLVPTTDQLDIGGLPFTRLGSRLYDGGGGFNVGLSRRTRMSADYNFQWVEFDQDPRFGALRGGHAHSPSLDLSHGLTDRFNVGASWTYRHAIVDGGESLIDTQQAIGYGSLQLGPNTSVRVSGGVSYLSFSSTGDTRLGPSYGASAAHRAGRVSLEAGYERAFVPGFGFGGVTPNQLAFARAEVPLFNGRAYVSGGFTLRRSEPLQRDGISLDSYWTTTTVGYRAARWLRVEGFYAGTHQTTSAQGTVNRARVGVQLVTFKPVRIE